MKLTRDSVNQAVFGNTRGRWVSEDGRWLIRRGHSGHWFIMSVKAGGPGYDTPDDVLLATLGLDQYFATRRDALEAFESAKEAGAAL
jgi:hypothetical protein